MSDGLLGAWQSHFYHEHDVVSRRVAQERGATQVHHMEFNRHGAMIRDWWTRGENLPDATRARLLEAAGGHVHVDMNGDLLEI